MAWLFWRTAGSLLVVMVMHAAINNLKDIVPSTLSSATNRFTFSASLVGWITVGLLWTAAAYFLFEMRGVSLREARDLDHLPAAGQEVQLRQGEAAGNLSRK